MTPEACGYGRLTRTSDYRRVYDAGRKVVGRYFVVFFAPQAAELPAVGITVSGKVGGAVVRNRQRRRIREALKRVMPECAPAADIVLVALGRITTSTFDGICTDIRGLVSRVRL